MKRPVWFALTSAVLLIAALCIVYAGYRKHDDNQKITQEIDRLKAQALDIAGKKQSLADRITYFQSDEFKERQAKEKLNLKRQDEEVVIIKPVAGLKESEKERSESAPQQEQVPSIPNYKKWWSYFFDPR